MADESDETPSRRTTGKGAAPSNRTAASVDNSEYAARDGDINQAEVDDFADDADSETDADSADSNPNATTPANDTETTSEDTEAFSEGDARQQLPEDMSAAEAAARLEAFAEQEGVAVNSKDGSVADTLDPSIVDSNDNFEIRDDDRMGGWEDFDPEDLAGGGKTLTGARGVEKRIFEGDDGPENVYFHKEGMTGSPNSEVTRERAGYRFMESMRAAAPQHEFGEFDDGTPWAVKREFDGKLVKHATDSDLENVDEDAATDMLATQMLAGNWDAHKGNVMINDEGDVRVIDFDRAVDDMESTGFERKGRGWREGHKKAARSLQEIKGCGMNQARADIYDRAQEMARETMETGDYRRVVSDVAEVDEKAAKHVAKNIALMATGKNDASVSKWREHARKAEQND